MSVCPDCHVSRCFSINGSISVQLGCCENTSKMGESCRAIVQSQFNKKSELSFNRLLRSEEKKLVDHCNLQKQLESSLQKQLESRLRNVDMQFSYCVRYVRFLGKIIP